MRKQKLTLKDLHMFSVESNMGKASASTSVKDVASHTGKTSATNFIQSWHLQVGEPQRDVEEEGIEKGMIGEEETRGANQEAGTGEERRISVVKQEQNHPDLPGTEFRKSTRKTRSLTLKMTLRKK